MNRIKNKWKTEFGSWVKVYGPRELAEDLTTFTGEPYTKHIVYRWIAGNTAVPVSAAHAIHKLSKGTITMAEIITHARFVKPEKRKAA